MSGASTASAVRSNHSTIVMSAKTATIATPPARSAARRAHGRRTDSGQEIVGQHDLSRALPRSLAAWPRARARRTRGAPGRRRSRYHSSPGAASRGSVTDETRQRLNGTNLPFGTQQGLPSDPGAEHDALITSLRIASGASKRFGPYEPFEPPPSSKSRSVLIASVNEERGQLGAGLGRPELEQLDERARGRDRAVLVGPEGGRRLTGLRCVGVLALLIEGRRMLARLGSTGVAPGRALGVLHRALRGKPRDDVQRAFVHVGRVVRRLVPRLDRLGHEDARDVGVHGDEHRVDAGRAEPLDGGGDRGRHLRAHGRREHDLLGELHALRGERLLEAPLDVGGQAGLVLVDDGDLLALERLPEGLCALAQRRRPS